MNGLTVQQDNLPDTIEDLSKFVLVGREKLTSVRAEIRAINKLELAEEVREQKKEEAQMLGEALLDAETRLGELFKEIPKAKNQYTNACCTTATSKTKEEIIKDLGFEKTQVNRFETLASNKDVVEQVKAEARENDDIPTRSDVLRIVKEKSEAQKYTEAEFTRIDEEDRIQKHMLSGIYAILRTNITDENLQIWYDNLEQCYKDTFDRDMERAISAYQRIREFYKNQLKIRRIK